MHASNIPALTTAQMIEVDRAMIEDYHIELIQMMENAGRNLADLARTRFLDGDPRGKNIVILAGIGGNGGGALVCARRLHNWGANVLVALTGTLNGVPLHQLDILRRMNIPTADSLAALKNFAANLIIDGIIGYSLKGAPRGIAADLIRWANAQSVSILSLDTPSGLDVTSGQVYSPTIKATATLTLALPKVGLLHPHALEYVGELYLADISVPPSLYAALGLDVPPLFAEQDVIRVEI